jgi:hypothetical protein
MISDKNNDMPMLRPNLKNEKNIALFNEIHLWSIEQKKSAIKELYSHGK